MSAQVKADISSPKFLYIVPYKAHWLAAGNHGGELVMTKESKSGGEKTEISLLHILINWFEVQPTETKHDVCYRVNLGHGFCLHRFQFKPTLPALAIIAMLCTRNDKSDFLFIFCCR